MHLFGGFVERSPATLQRMVAAALILCAASPRSADAVTYTWNGASGAMWDLSAANWVDATGTPWDGTSGPTNAATFSLTGSNSAAVSGLVTTNNVTFAPTTTGTFTLAGGTIALGGGTSARIMNVLSGGTVGTTTASTLTIASTITSTTNFFIGGYGTTILSGSNSLSGTVTIGSGSSQVLNPTVRINNSNALDGAAAVFLVGSGTNSGYGQTLTLGNGVTITGKSLGGSANNTRASLQVAAGSSGTWDGALASTALTLYADGGLTIGSGTGTTAAVGTLRGSGTGVMNSALTSSFTKTDPGTWIITSASNSFTAGISISTGVLQVASITNAGSASPIGTNATISLGQNQASSGGWGTLRYTGSAGGSTNRTIAIQTSSGSNGGAIIDTAVVGQTLTLAGNVTTSSTSTGFLRLTGSGNGILSGNITPSSTNSLNFEKAGTGTWTLSGSNGYQGRTTISAGMLALGSANALPASGTIQFGGGTLQFSPTNTADISARVLGSTAGAIGIDTNGQSVTFASSLAASNTGGLTKTGAGTLALSASNAYLGTTTVNGGTLLLGHPFALASAAPTVVVNAGTLDLGGSSITLTSLSGTSAAGAITSSVAGALTVTATSAGNTTYGGGINDGSATITLAKIGAGTLTLSGSSNATGGTLLNGGVISVSNANALGSSGPITFGGGTLRYAAGNSVDYSSRILGSASAVQIDTNGQSVTFASAIDASNVGGFTKSGAGMLTVSGSSLPGTVVLNGGTTVVDPGASGSFSAATLKIGNLSSGTSVATIASGAVALTPAAFGGVIIADGANTAALDITGGTTSINLVNNSARVMIGNKGTGSMHVSGGNVTITGANQVYVGGDASYTQANANGSLTVSGGTLAITGSGQFVLAGSGTSGHTGIAGTLNLTGGELHTIRPITTSTSTLTSTVNFNGGVLKPLASNVAFMTGLSAANVLSGGARIDTNGFDITVGQALLAGTGTNAGGGLTKSGGGTLTLTGASTFTGATTIAGGTLALSGGVNRLATATTLAFTGGTIATNGVSQTVTGLTVADATSAAVVGTGTSSATLSVVGPITLGGGSGSSTLLIQPQLSSASTASDLTLSVPAGITVNAGGDLRLGVFGFGTTSKGTAKLNGSTGVTVSGGSFTLDRMLLPSGTTSSSASGIASEIGSFTMPAGRLFIDNTFAVDRRITFGGLVNVTGGTMSVAQNLPQDMALGLQASGTNVLSPASFDRNMGVVFYTGATTLSTSVPLGRVFTRATGTYTITSSATGGNIGTLNINDGSATPGVGSTVQLGSNLTLVAGGAARDGLPQITAYSLVPEAGGRADLGIDTGGYTLDLSGNSNVWQPNSTTVSGTAVQAYWQLSSTSGTGRFIANGFNFVYASGSLNAYTAVGPNVILESRSGNSVANNLGSTGTTGSMTIDPASTFVYSGTAAVATPSTLTSARSIGNLEVAGSGALRLLGISGSIGNVAVSNGRLILGGTSIPLLPAVAVTGGIFDLNGYGTTITDLTGSAGGTITSSSNTTVALALGGENSTRYDGVLANSAGTLNLVKQGGGTLTLGGVNTFTGTTSITGGALVLDNALALQNSTFDTTGSGSLSFGSLSAASFGGLTGSGNLDLTALPSGFTVGGGNQSSTYGGILSGAGGLTKTGTGTFIVTASQAFSGATTISQGTLQVGNGSTTGWLPAGAITNNGVLAFNRSDNVTASGGISGSGSVRQAGGGQLTLSGSNSYAGGTLITGTGSLAAGNAAALGTGTITLQTAQTISPSPILNLTAGMTLSNPLVMAQAGGSRNNLRTAGVSTIAGPITVTGTGSGANVFENGGTLLTITGNITAASSFTGSLSFRLGQIVISGTIDMPAATFDLNAGGTTTIVSTGNVWSRMDFNATNNLARLGADNALAPNAVVQFSGNSTGGGLNLNGFNQSLPGFTNSSGTLAGPGNRIFNDAATDSTLTLAGLSLDRSSIVALADGTGGGRLRLVMNSAGRTQTLGSATSSYTGGTTIVAGTIALGHANGLGGGGPLAVHAGSLDLRGFSPTVGTLSGSAGGVITSGTVGASTFTVSSDSASTFAGLIQNGLGTVGLTKEGSGALRLTAAHTYTGPTNVNAGLLAVNGSLASVVMVGPSGEIAGSGSVGGLGGAGLVGPGNSPGILTAPSVDPSGGLDFAFEFTQAAPNYASPTASDNDLLWLTDSTPFTGSLTGANTVSIYLTQSAAALGELTGGFFTQTAGDFFPSIASATFQYFVQDASGTFSYNGQAYKTLAQYDPSKSVSISTVAANSGQVMQLVVVPEPEAFVLAGLGVGVVAWVCRRRRRMTG